MNRTFHLVVTCLAVSAGTASADDPSPQALADVLTGEAAGGAADNPQCQLFTADEIAVYLGEPVAAAGNAGLGFGCQWFAADEEGDAMVTIVPVDYAEAPSLAPGFREAPVGADGFVVPEMGGWAAGAVDGDSFVKVALVGAGASDASVLALLAETLARRAR